MKIFLMLGCSFLIYSCKKEVKQIEIKSDTIVEVTVDTIANSDNSQNSLDWQGTYEGVIPCADCEGIETEITINYDLTYKIKTKYLGKGDGKTFEEKGSFAWDKMGSTISLKSTKLKSSQYKVGENQLIQLDMKGQVITGGLSEKYVLKKQ